jgi:hypothetical protein
MKVMKQTAIEWFTNQLEKHYVFQDIKNTTAFLHAKEMEKEQIMDAWIEAGEYGYLSQESDRVLAEQYYNETFNTK